MSEGLASGTEARMEALTITHLVVVVEQIFLPGTLIAGYLCVDIAS